MKQPYDNLTGKMNQKGIALIDYALLSAFAGIVIIVLLTYIGNVFSAHLEPQQEAYHQPSQTIVLDR